MDLKKYCAVALLVFICTNYVFAELTRQEILDRADERIKQYRMSEVELVILDFNGEPIAEETNVKIEQVRHQFLFGCNLFRYEKMGDAKLDALYKQRYKELFNFATLGFYWGSYEWQQGKTAEEYWKGVAKWCGANGIMTKGHPLFWTIEPRWVNELDESKVALKLSAKTYPMEHQVENFTIGFGNLTDGVSGNM